MSYNQGNQKYAKHFILQIETNNKEKIPRCYAYIGPYFNFSYDVFPKIAFVYESVSTPLHWECIL